MKDEQAHLVETDDTDADAGVSRTGNNARLHASVEQLEEENATLKVSLAALQTTKQDQAAVIANLTEELTALRDGADTASSAVTFSAEAEVASWPFGGVGGWVGDLS